MLWTRFRTNGLAHYAILTIKTIPAHKHEEMLNDNEHDRATMASYGRRTKTTTFSADFSLLRRYLVRNV